ncbi:hypothetical protein KEJ15_04135 [Candidatus Bathyarchaeota archaeon]|nr:hypothetical protein [Candidatus Bathyarchaeota archaeon]
MFDNILRRVRLEVELLVLVAVLSIAVSSLLIADAGIALRVEKYDLASTAVRILELIFDVVWLTFSSKFIVEINRLRRKHFFFHFVHKLERLEDEQKKTKATELVRDMMAFYRAYYLKVKAVMALAIAVSFSIIVAIAYLWLYGRMSFWEAFFRWALSSFMLLIASTLYIHVHINWGRKLLKLKNAEKKLSEMLGGPIEA